MNYLEFGFLNKTFKSSAKIKEPENIAVHCVINGPVGQGYCEVSSN